MFVRLAPDADPESVRDGLNEEVLEVCARRGGPGCNEVAGEPLSSVRIVEPTDVVNFGRVRSMPLVVGGVLAGLAAATLMLTLVTAVRRRRRDLAVLKTLGFTRRQVTTAVLWQATTIAGSTLIVAIPAGLVLGRFLWRFRADDLGIVFEPRVPVAALVLVGAVAVVLANLIAALPGRAAATTRPAAVLRSE
jgi:ABC-type lipoprotein release transport system permease subunit